MGPDRQKAEDVFLAWLLHLPDGTDLAEAARREIDRLDEAAPLPHEPRRLRSLFVEAVQAGSFMPGRRSRHRYDA